MQAILIINGPNLNLLGKRNPEIYGTETLADIERMCRDHAARIGVRVVFFQSNHEGVLIDELHAAISAFDGVILNAGGYAHSSIALRDAVEAIGIPVVDTHLSDIRSREHFRQVSLIETVSIGMICGLGARGYLAAMDLVVAHLRRR